MFHLTTHVNKLFGVSRDPWGHIGEEIGWLRSISFSRASRALLIASYFLLLGQQTTLLGKHLLMQNSWILSV